LLFKLGDKFVAAYRWFGHSGGGVLLNCLRHCVSPVIELVSIQMRFDKWEWIWCYSLV